VVLTADHGDSLGEEGRWGHAYTIFPEILQIPLIMHLPARLREGLQYDPKALCFSTDITPSIYYLLGRRPVVAHAVLGRPLFTESLAEQQLYYRPSHLVVSSYGPVYGILRDGGRLLYIADGVNDREYFYELGSGSASTKMRVSPSIRTENRQMIREHLGAIHRLYNHPLQQPPETPQNSRSLAASTR